MKRAGFWLVNRSGYDSAALRRLFTRGLLALRLKRKPGLVIKVVTAPARSKGCADVGGNKIIIAIAPPSVFSMRRLARVFEHEVAHVMGFHHGQMAGVSRELLMSPDSGETPRWAQDQSGGDLKLPWRGRAPRQLRSLRRDGLTRK
jgi:hypothetical protein